MEALLIIIVVIFVGGWIFRRLAPFLLLHLFKQFAKRAENAASNTKTRKEGEVNVRDTQRREKKKINQEVGEYIDYEEIKEN